MTTPAAMCGPIPASEPSTTHALATIATRATTTDTSCGSGPHGSVVAVVNAIARSVTGWLAAVPRRQPATADVAYSTPMNAVIAATRARHERSARNANEA